MTILLYLLLIGGLLIFISQASYAYGIAKVNSARDTFTSGRLLPLILPADMLHFIHHSLHAVCGLASVLATASILRPESWLSTQWICLVAIVILIADSIFYLISERKHNWRGIRDGILSQWKFQKSPSPDHDNEVSLYRILNELTRKNLLRDAAHAALFVILYVLSFA